MDEQREKRVVLVVRKRCFGLPTACPSCLPVYIYLRLANVPFDVHFDLANPDSDDIPFVEYGDYMVFNSEKGGVIENLKENGMIDLDSNLPSHSIPEWVSTNAMISSWLADATLYELWVGSDGSAADKIYFSNLPWLIGKVLHWKQTQAVKQLLGITNANAIEKEAEVVNSVLMCHFKQVGPPDYRLAIDLMVVTLIVLVNALKTPRLDDHHPWISILKTMVKKNGSQLEKAKD